MCHIVRVEALVLFALQAGGEGLPSGQGRFEKALATQIFQGQFTLAQVVVVLTGPDEAPAQFFAEQRQCGVVRALFEAFEHLSQERSGLTDAVDRFEEGARRNRSPVSPPDQGTKDP